MSAIAAFLVLSTPGAFAQEAPTVTMTPPVAAPTPQTPPTVPEPSTTAPVATPQTAQPAAPAPIIRVPLDIPDEDASLSYSDLSFLLRTCQNLSAAYARRRYRLNYEENGK